MASLTIGVTTARAPECKRGVAVNLAARVARRDARRAVCVVDGDPEARDVTTRLPVPGPMLEDFAEPVAPTAWRLGRSEAPPLAVLGNGGGDPDVLRRGAEAARRVLRESFDVVVWDLAGGARGPGRVVGATLGALDWLLVATTPSVGASTAAARLLGRLDEERARGLIDPRVQVGVVWTGDESTGRVDGARVARAVRAAVVGEVPQLWGRAEPNPGFGAALPIAPLDRAFDALLARVRAVPAPRVSPGPRPFRDQHLARGRDKPGPLRAERRADATLRGVEDA